MPVLGTRAPDFALPEPGTDREWQLADFDAEALQFNDNFLAQLA